MSLTSQPDASKENILVSVPPTRADVIHPCDVMEDYAIVYGTSVICATYTIGIILVL